MERPFSAYDDKASRGQYADSDLGLSIMGPWLHYFALFMEVRYLVSILVLDPEPITDDAGWLSAPSKT